MPVAVVTNCQLSLPSLELLAREGALAALFLPQPANEETPALRQWAGLRGIDCHEKTRAELPGAIASFLDAFPDSPVLCYGLAWKLPAALTERYNRIFNVHFSLLPAFAGPVPVFWQVRSGTAAGGITIHQVTDRVDGGPIAARQRLDLIAGEPAGWYQMRLSEAAAPLLRRFVQEWAAGAIRLQPQAADGRTYQRRPGPADIRIDWDAQDALEVEQLVNACNPLGGGAPTLLRGMELRLLEVSPADGTAPAGTPGGTIVHADPLYGLFVACRDGGILRINVARSALGHFSGARLAALGFRAGERFGTCPLPTTSSPSILHQ